MTSVKSLGTMFYQLKSRHAPVGTYLKRFRHQDDHKYYRCSIAGKMVLTWEHFFRHCQWKDQQKNDLKRGGEGEGNRLQCIQMPTRVGLSAVFYGCDKAVMGLLATTDVGEFLPR